MSTSPLSDILSILREDRRFDPPAEFSRKAAVKSIAEYEALYKRAADDPEGFWAECARELQWFKPFTKVLEWNFPFAKWFLGGELKRKEKISARLGDILSLLYLSSCALKRFEDDGRPAADAPLLHWSVQDALYRARLAMDGASILVAEQKTDLLASICDRVVVLDAGRVALDGPAAEVLGDPRLADLGVAAPASVRLRRLADAAGPGPEALTQLDGALAMEATA